MKTSTVINIPSCNVLTRYDHNRAKTRRVCSDKYLTEADLITTPKFLS